ncbi:glycosyltransferase [Niallia taxi]|uniref:glycosyltransferase n=1 Tax=Niallia taxi TaxID=2499688 RepID=UPI003982C960
MKLLIVSAVGELGGGAESMLYELVHSIKADVEVEVLFMQEGKLKEKIDMLGITTHVLFSPQMRNITGVIKWMAKYTKFVRRNHYTYVLNWMPKAHLFTAIPNSINKKPTLWWQHGVPDPPNFFDKLTIKLPAKKIGSSSTIAMRAQKRLTKKPVFCAFPGSDHLRHRPNESNRSILRGKLEIDDDTLLIGNVGRLQSWKRQDILIKTLEKLIQAKIKAKLILVGGNLYNLDNEYEEKLNKMIREKKLGDYIITTGNQLDVEPYYDAMDIYLHTADGEPFGIVMVEAMLHEKPVIAIKSPGSVEIVEDRVTGLLLNSENPNDISKDIINLVKDNNLLKQFGIKGRKRAIEMFSNDQMGKEILREIRTDSGLDLYKKEVI